MKRVEISSTKKIREIKGSQNQSKQNKDKISGNSKGFKNI